MRSGWLLGLVVVVACGLMQPAQAAYTRRYGAVTRGALTMTGNALGFDRYLPANRASSTDSRYPGTAGAIGAFASQTGQASTSWPTATYGATTWDWRNNSTAARLRYVDRATNQPVSNPQILYAILVWGATYQVDEGTYNGVSWTAATLSLADRAVNPTLARPDGGAGTVSRSGYSELQGEGLRYYVAWSDVTATVRAAGPGSYRMSGIPALMTTNNVDDLAGGWSLIVAWGHPSQPVRSLNIWTGTEIVGPSTTWSTAYVDGFCTPSAGTVNARVLVSAMEGDRRYPGDRLELGRPSLLGYTYTSLTGPRNPVSDFFGAQITDDQGNLDTSGAPGTPNHGTTTLTTGGRQGWDLTNVSGNTALRNSQTSMRVRVSTDQDQVAVTALGLQCDVGAPMSPVANLTVNKPVTSVGDILTYTASYSNVGGTAAAQDLVYTSRPATGQSFVPGSVTVNGVTQTTADPLVGINVGTVAPGTTVTVSYQFRVDALPLAPLPAVFDVSGTWDYQFASCPGFPLIQSSGTAGTVSTPAARLEVIKQANTADAFSAGATITYTITVKNTGSAATSGTTLRDPLAAYLSYVPNSARLNNVALTGAATYPFEQPRLINSPNAAAGVIAVGATATITFSAVVGTGAPTPIRNVAYADPDGTGPAPEIPASTENPRLAADLAVAKTDGRTTMAAGGTTTYTITVSNLGPNTTTALTVQDVLPTTLYDPVFTPSTGAYDPATGIWTGLNLAAGQSVTLTVAVKVSGLAQGSVTNTVIVSGSPGVANDPNLSNNTATDTNTLEYLADLSITKDSGGNLISANGVVDYLILVTNHGPTTVDSVKLVELLPAGLSFAGLPTDVQPYEPRRGYYTPETQIWSGLALEAGESARMYIHARVTAAAGTQVTNRVQVEATPGYTDPNTTNNQATDTDTVTTQSLYTIEGMVYNDSNHNALRDPAEIAPGPYDLWVKRVDVATGTVLGATPVNNSDGTYVFASVQPGNFRLLLDDNNDLTDTTSTLPQGWIHVNPADGTRPVTVTNASVYLNDFGLWFGETVAGEVFADDGAGGGIAGNAVRDGAELPLVNVAVSAQDGSGTTFDVVYTDVDGKYMLWIPGLYSRQPLRIVEANPTGYISVSGSPGDTGGYYELATDTVFWHGHFGEHHTGVNFGDSAGLTIGGYVYHDLNHNGQRDPGELGLEIAGLYGKGMPDGASAAVQVILVDPATGRVSTRVGPGTYTVLVDNNSDPADIAPYAPPGWIPTEAPTQMITGVVVTNEPVDNLNVGFYHGMRVTGRVFEDNGLGTGGIANNGLQDGDEAGLPLVVITAYDSDGNVLATTTTDAAGDWELWVPYTAVSDVVTIVETNPEKYLSTGGRPGDTGGTYDRTTDTLTFTAVWGTLYEGVTFADVLAPTFAADGQQQARPGSMVYYPHTFTTSTAGQVTFSASKVDDPATLRWPEVLLYHDVNGDGLLDDGDTLLTGPLDVARGEEVKILAVVYVPVEAPLGASSLATVSADFVFANADPALTWQGQVRDLTTVSEGAGVVLHKAADKETVSPGEIITYTLTYTNNGLEPITDLVLADKTPTYTTFVAAPAPTAAELPATLTGCTLTMPAAGEMGEMTWAFAGSLAPGSSGTVTYQVRVDRATP